MIDQNENQRRSSILSKEGSRSGSVTQDHIQGSRKSSISEEVVRDTGSKTATISGRKTQGSNPGSRRSSNASYNNNNNNINSSRRSSNYGSANEKNSLVDSTDIPVVEDESELQDSLKDPKKSPTNWNIRDG